MAFTLSDIAKRVGVHQSTVSVVLNKGRSTIRVSDQTRQRILTTAKELRYRPSFSARALAKGRTFTLGMQCGNIYSPHNSELVETVMEEADKRGYQTLISVTDMQEGELPCLESLLKREVDGALLWMSSLQPGTEMYDLVIEEKFPAVVYTVNVEGLCSVTSDWTVGIDEAVRHLKNKGHAKIGFVGNAAMAKGYYPKQHAIRDACTKYRMDSCEFYIENENILEQAVCLATKLAHDPELPSVLIAPSDFVAIGLCRGFFNQGLRIPDDIAMVGMDGMNLGKYFYPSLTTIAQDRQRLVTSGLDMLIEMIDKKEGFGRRMSCPTKLIVRESA